MNIYTASLKGKRPTNEDAHQILLNLGKSNKYAPINFYGIFDGHGGAFVSNFLKDVLPRYFIDKRLNYPLNKRYVTACYNHLNTLLKTKYAKNVESTGSTCLVIIEYKQNDNRYLNILNTGDSRAIICKNNIAHPLTIDHKPNFPSEKSRIESVGGKIAFDGLDWRIKDLSVSRSFGDISSQPCVTYLPDMFRYTITKADQFIVMACDGLWDVMSNQDVANYVLLHCYNPVTNKRINKDFSVAKKLAEFAISKGSSDNVSIIIIFNDS